MILYRFCVQMDASDPDNVLSTEPRFRSTDYSATSYTNVDVLAETCSGRKYGQSTSNSIATNHISDICSNPCSMLTKETITLPENVISMNLFQGHVVDRGVDRCTAHISQPSLSPKASAPRCPTLDDIEIQASWRDHWIQV